MKGAEAAVAVREELAQLLGGAGGLGPTRGQSEQALYADTPVPPSSSAATGSGLH
ncbi:hypothetical protein [Streptomyces sp. NBC_01451]|uniref:hypothetical protein n=1 Tax=Streptomyces sp. NBC_01451 TaxID=2903872 RepID=UPI002E341F8F|nr:hypothetical protein [Streptomyces sp. NBC_01451]